MTPMGGSRDPQHVAVLRLRAILLTGMVAWTGDLGAQAAGTAPFDSAERHVIDPFLAAHCLECHGDKEPAAGVRLDDLPFEIDTVEAAERWQKMLDVLNSGEMPPEEKPRPDDAAKA